MIVIHLAVAVAASIVAAVLAARAGLPWPLVAGAYAVAGILGLLGSAGAAWAVAQAPTQTSRPRRMDEAARVRTPHPS